MDDKGLAQRRGERLSSVYSRCGKTSKPESLEGCTLADYLFLQTARCFETARHVCGIVLSCAELGAVLNVNCEPHRAACCELAQRSER
eukprot:4824208-Amphidinium_carterae.1